MSFVFKNQDYKATLLAVSAAALLYSTYIHYKGDAYSKDKTGIPTPDSAYPYIGKTKK
jgi:hypothetical protein